MNKTIWWVVGIIVVILLLVLAINGPNLSQNPDTSPSPSLSASPSPTASSASGSAASKTYSALVAQYGSNRIQFDRYCQAIPNIAVFKTGTKVMFDNRSGDARIITIGGTRYSFQGYGYRIIRLGSTNLPVTFYLDCGSAVHVGTITVEK